MAAPLAPHHSTQAPAWMAPPPAHVRREGPLCTRLPELVDGTELRLAQAGRLLPDAGLHIAATQIMYVWAQLRKL